MDILDINISRRPKETWIGKAMNKLIEIILWPFVMLFMLLLFITLPIIDFVKYKILGRPEEKLSSLQDYILFKDSNLTIYKEPINYGVDKLAEDFQFTFVDSSDEMEVWKLKFIPDIPALQDLFVTGLYFDLNNEIILQRITSENGQPSSELIGLDKQSYNIHTYKKIGLFSLFKFDADTDEIVGASRKESIRIKIKKSPCTIE